MNEAGDNLRKGFHSLFSQALLGSNMESKEGEGKCFTFLWHLENISYSLERKGERIESPAFVVDAIEKTKFKLWLYPRGGKDGNCIAYFINREADSKGPGKIEINYELAFISKDGSVLKSLGVHKGDFDKGGGFGWDGFLKREEMYISGRSSFLPEDTLRARCRIWKSVRAMTEDVLCIAHTRIGVEKRSFLWNVKNFSTLESEKKCNYQIKSIDNEAPLMSVDLSLTGGLSFEETVHFELSLQDKTVKFCTLQLFLIDAEGNQVECNQNEFWFNNLNRSKQFTFFYTKKKLMAKKNMYLPNDVLSLHWKITFSQGVVFEKNVDVQCGSISSESNTPNVQSVKKEKEMLLPHSLNDSLKSLYDRQFLCDVKLKTSISVFPAHKIILSASSPVFDAMFSNDMKEKESDCVSIEDLKDDAVRRMLLYIYTARMEDVTWKSASHLYVAADKYAILSLKNNCSSYLKEHLSLNNACELLLLADFHADNDLKSAVQYYILKHDKDIINSDEWKQLMETNGKLAAETLCLRYK